MLTAGLSLLPPSLNNLMTGFTSVEFVSSNELSELLTSDSDVIIGVPHLALILAAWNVLAARSVKSIGCVGFITEKVTTTGAKVPGVNAGIFTTALTGVPTTVSDCKPVPAFTWSTVTVPGPLDTPNDTIPPGAKSPSVTVVVGVQVSAQRTLIKAEWNVLAARNVKSTI